jgi:hypothetical protein
VSNAPGPLVGMGYGLMGYGPQGFDDISPVSYPTPTTIPLPTMPVARFWDAETQSFIQNDDGTFLPVNPIDQMVQMLLTIEQGTVPALGNVGQRYRAVLLGVPAQKAQVVVLAETQRVLAALIAAGDITLGNVSIDVLNQVITVNYVNNRLPFGGPNTQSTKSVTVPYGTSGSFTQG